MPMPEGFVISRSPVQVWSPAPIPSTTYGRSAGTAISCLVVTCVLLIAPERAFAEDRGGLVIPASVFATAQALDVHSTYVARLSGKGVEGNAWMDVSTGKQIAIKAGVTTAMIAAAHVVHRRHPVVAKVMLYGGAAAVGFIASHNYRIATSR